MRLIYLSPVPWASFAQRAHKFIEYFHLQSGDDVLWIEPYPTRLPTVQDLSNTSTKKPYKGISSSDWLTVIQPKLIIPEPISGAGWFNHYAWKAIRKSVSNFVGKGEKVALVVGKPSELALQLLSEFNFNKTIYDAMDNFPAFYTGISKTSMYQKELSLISQTDFIWASSTIIQNNWGEKTRSVLVNNACDTEMLPKVKLNRKPIREVFGYIGTIAKWFDWGFIYELALLRPKAIIRIIGPTYSSIPVNLPINIEIFPECEHKDALVAMMGFSVGLIPFKITELTDSVDPIKYYEYRCLGLPVISTKFGEMNSHSQKAGVFVVDEKNSIDCAVIKAIAHEETKEEIEEFRRNNSWQSRFFAQVKELV